LPSGKPFDGFYPDASSLYCIVIEMKKKNTKTESPIDVYIREPKSKQTFGSCVMHSYCFVLNFFLVKEGLSSRVSFPDLNRIYLQWMNSEKMEIASQQDGIRNYLLAHQNTKDFKCTPALKSMYPFVFEGKDIPPMNDVNCLDPKDLELYQTSIFHYYCQEYVRLNTSVSSQYKATYPLLCDDTGLRGYVNIYEFDQYLAKSGKALLDAYSSQRPGIFTLSIPTIKFVEQSNLKDDLSALDDSMVLFYDHSRVIFDYGIKQIYDSNLDRSSRVMGFNEYYVNNKKFRTPDKPVSQRIEYMQIEPSDPGGDSPKE